MCGTSHQWPCSTSGRPVRMPRISTADGHRFRRSYVWHKPPLAMFRQRATLSGQGGNAPVQTCRGCNPETFHAQPALVDPGGRDPAAGSLNPLRPTFRTPEAAGRRVEENKTPTAASGTPRPVTQARTNRSPGSTMLRPPHPGGVSAPPPTATAGAPTSVAAIPAAIASL